MPKKKRIWYPGATYHIMSRGNRRNSIFKEKTDYFEFLNCLVRTKERYPFTIHTLCLMTNHFHMAIETEDIEIWKIMHWLLLTYAANYNIRYRLTGHLFENRYIGQLIEDDRYFLEVSRYIHLNPVKAMMVKEPIAYEYSSYGLYMREEEEKPAGKTEKMITAARQCRIKKAAVPAENLAEAQKIGGIEVYGLHTLEDAVRLLEGRGVNAGIIEKEEHGSGNTIRIGDFSEVKGQRDLLDAVVLAATGGHNLLMIGEPGCGKSMIASRIPGILPEMTEEEALEVTKIQSIAGNLKSGQGLVRNRPFRAPHHNVSLNAMIGGGTYAQPGEVSLAHGGILFLDELAEFSRSTLDALRQPLENKQVTISRVNGNHTYPAGFMFVAAMNPCPCGYYPGSKCRCSDYEVIHYRSKISGPILERVDIQKWVRRVDYFDLGAKETDYTSAQMRHLVERARKIQEERYRDEEGIYCNAQMTVAHIQKYCGIDEESTAILREHCEKYGYSARVIHKLLRMARTAADVRESTKIEKEDIIKVLGCRELDKNNSQMYTV